MNDKMFSIALFLTFIIIGMNGFLVMASELKDAQGNDIQVFYDMSGNTLQTPSDNLVFDVDTTASSSSPNTATGFTPAKDSEGDLFGLATPTKYIGGMVAGVQLVMAQIDYMFTPIGEDHSPFYGIILAIIVFVTVIQAMGLGYLTVTLIRIVTGRQV